jgi:prolyl-tRNA synthetase
MRGNDELNENKLESVLGTNVFRAATSDELIRFTGADGGSIGPVNLKTKVRVIADSLLKDANGMVSGANQDGFHYKNIDLARDTQISEFYDLRTVKEGEPNPIDGTPVRIVKAIELGHIFKLGTRYSDAMGATFLDADGKENPIIMGSYGIGVERVIACFIEQNYDDFGIKWNKELTPFHAHIVGLNTKKAEDVRELCDKFYSDLKAAGLDALYDDRDDSVGVKFNDADLLGVPVQIVVGSKNLANGQVELKYRLSGEKQLVKIEDVIKIVKDYYTTI